MCNAILEEIKSTLESLKYLGRLSLARRVSGLFLRYWHLNYKLAFPFSSCDVALYITKATPLKAFIIKVIEGSKD